MPPEQDEVDEILAGIEEPQDGIPMTGEEGQAAGTETEPAAAPAQTWNAKEWEFDWKGQKVAPDSREKAIQWMNLGHNHSQRQAEFNRIQAAKEREWAAKEGKYKGYDRFAEVDAFVKENPDWWKHVEESWQTRAQQAQQAGAAPDIQQHLQPILKELNETKSFISQLQEERLLKEQEQHDSALSDEIETIRKANPNIDFDAADESGKSLETRILEHCKEIGSSSFRVGYRDYLHDHLLEQTKAQTLAAQAKQGQDKAPRRILGTTPTPQRKPTSQVSTKGRSYEDLTQMALEEHGITS